MTATARKKRPAKRRKHKVPKRRLHKLMQRLKRPSKRPGLARLFAYDVLALAILGAVIAIGISNAPQIFLRTFEALRDFFHSLGYAFFLLPEPPSMGFSSGMIESFPRVWAEFVNGAQAVAERLISLENFYTYCKFLGRALKVALPLLVLGIIIIGIYILCVWFSVRSYNTKWNRKSKPLRCFEKFYDYAYKPLRHFWRGFKRHLRQHKGYKIAFVLLVLYFLNVFTIALEFAAWLFYFVIELDVVNIGVQVIKLCYDLLLMALAMPWWLWIPALLFLFDRLRRSIGFARLEAHEEDFRKFINERPIVMLITAPMREGKTTFLASTMRSFEKIFRKQAKKGMREIDLRFPNFPWIILEKAIQRGFKSHELYTLATVRDWVKCICQLHEDNQNVPEKVRKCRKALSKKYGLRFDNILFGYDTKRWPTIYNRGLGKEQIYDAIHDYAQLYFIYITPSILMANLPVRMDDDWDDRGNWPEWEDDFFRKEPSTLKKSRLAHLLIQDMLRLGKKKDPDGPYNDSLEFGIIGETEIGKERGNQYDTAGMSRNDDEANLLNDMHNQQLKLIGHSATINYFPFIRFIADEQRAQNWLADARQLCDIITIRDKSKHKILMPFFALGEALYLLADATLGKLHNKKVYTRGDQTLSLWFLHNVIHAKISHHYETISSIFGGYKIKATVQNGAEDQAMKKLTVFMSDRKNYPYVFPTDSWRPFYHMKASRAKKGLSDVPVFKDLHPDMDEYEQMKTYLVPKLLAFFGEAPAPKAAEATAGPSQKDKGAATSSASKTTEAAATGQVEAQKSAEPNTTSTSDDANVSEEENGLIFDWTCTRGEGPDVIDLFTEEIIKGLETGLPHDVIQERAEKAVEQFLAKAKNDAE